jgi:hypothetical protein
VRQERFRAISGVGAAQLSGRGRKRLRRASGAQAGSSAAGLIEAAKTTGADESGKAFEKAFKKIVAVTRRKKST